MRALEHEAPGFRDHEVDPGTRRQSREFFEELDRLEQEVGRSVCPLRFQGYQHLPLRCEGEAILCDGRPEDVAGEPLETGAVVCCDGDGGVQVEALEVPLARPAGGDPGGVGIATDLDDARAGTRAERHAPLNGRGADARQRGRLLGHGIDVRRVLDGEAAAREEPQHAAADGGEDAGDLLVARWLSRVELERAVFPLGEKRGLLARNPSIRYVLTRRRPDAEGPPSQQFPFAARSLAA